MNSITRLRKSGKRIVFSLLVFIVILFLLSKLQEIDFGIKTRQIEKTIFSQELSPDNLSKVILYMQEFNPKRFTGYYKDYFPNKAIVSVEHQESLVNRTIFTGEERIGNPHWLGNDSIFFTTYCGTSCKGVYLINTKSKETSLAVLSFMLPNQEEKEWYTHFRDWFGEEFKFSGLTKHIYAKMQNGKSYLIFEMEDDEHNILGKKQLLFTGNSLKEE